MHTFKGTFQGVSPVLPHGYLRALNLGTDEKTISFHVGFKKIEGQIKGIKKGAKIEIDYDDYDNFTIRKI